MAAVVTENLTKNYGNTGALADLSLTIAAGQIYGVVGPDGAGKTSLLRILAGILTPSSGRALVLDCDVVRQAEQLKQSLGYMAQKFALYADLTVRENLDFFADLFRTPRAGLEEHKRQLLRFADLDRFQDRLAGNLSGGMKQKLALCCTLVHTPQILILDEPTTGVDPVSRQEFWEMLRPLPAQGTTVLVSTAYLDEAGKCDQIALLNLGRVLCSGTPEELRAAVRGQIFELRGSGLDQVAADLGQQPWVGECRRLGDRLRLRLRDQSTSAKPWAAWLKKHGSDFTITASPASLEDLFIELIAG